MIGTPLDKNGTIQVLAMLGLILPGLAVSIRRLHDTNRSGWWLLAVLIPIVGGIMLIVFYATDGDLGDNRFGPDPKAPALEL